MKRALLMMACAGTGLIATGLAIYQKSTMLGIAFGILGGCLLGMTISAGIIEYGFSRSWW